MAYQLTLLNPKFRNWVKAGIALNVTKDGIEDFVEKNNNAFHTSAIGKLPVGAMCISCSTGNVVACRSQNSLCKFSSGACLVHVAANRYKACGASVCNVIRDEVTKKHRYQPNWKNTDARKWCNNSWEIAKCYMADGYESKSTATDTDLPGLLSVVINNKVFQAAVSNSLTNRNNIFCQAREARNEILHNASMEVTDTELRDYINTMILLLSDPKCIASDPRAKKAITILTQIIKDTLTITTEDEVVVREASRKAIQEETQQAMRQINDRSLTIMTEMKDEKSKLSKEIKTEQEWHLKSMKRALEESERTLHSEKEKSVSTVRKERTESISKMKDENDKAIIVIRNERALNKQEIEIETQKAVTSIRNVRMEVKDEAAKVIMDIRKEKQNVIDTSVRIDIDHHSKLIQKLSNELGDMRKEFKTTQCVAKEGHYAIRASKAAVHDIYNKYKSDLRLGLKKLYTDDHGAFQMQQKDGYFIQNLDEVPNVSYQIGLTGCYTSPYSAQLDANKREKIYTTSFVGNVKTITFSHYIESDLSSFRKGLHQLLIKNENTLTSYDFLFFIPLRDDFSSEKVEETIKHCVLAFCSDEVLGASEILLSTILRREKCFIIFYGPYNHVSLQAAIKGIEQGDYDAHNTSVGIMETYQDWTS